MICKKYIVFIKLPRCILSMVEKYLTIILRVDRQCYYKNHIQYIPRNLHTVFALLCFVVVIHWLIFPYPSGLLHWHCGNLTIAPVPTKQPWWIWINTSCEFIMNDCITTTKQSTTKPHWAITWIFRKINCTKLSRHNKAQQVLVIIGVYCRSI